MDKDNSYLVLSRTTLNGNPCAINDDAQHTFESNDMISVTNHKATLSNIFCH